MARIEFFGHCTTAAILLYMLQLFWTSETHVHFKGRPPVQLQGLHLLSQNFKMNCDRGSLFLDGPEHFELEGPVQLRHDQEEILAESVSMELQDRTIILRQPQLLGSNVPLQLGELQLLPESPALQINQMNIQFTLPILDDSLNHIMIKKIIASEDSLKLLNSLQNELHVPQAEKTVGETKGPNANIPQKTKNSHPWSLIAEKAQIAQSALFVRAYLNQVSFAGENFSAKAPSGRIKWKPLRLYLKNASIIYRGQVFLCENALIDLESGEVYADTQNIGNLLP